MPRLLTPNSVMRSPTLQNGTAAQVLPLPTTLLSHAPLSSKLRLLLIDSHPTWRIPSLVALKALFPGTPSPIDAVPLTKVRSPLSKDYLKILFYVSTLVEMEWQKEIERKGRSYLPLRYGLLLIAVGMKPTLITYGYNDLGVEWMEKVWLKIAKIIKGLKDVPIDLLAWVKSIIYVPITHDIITCGSVTNPSANQAVSRVFLDSIILYSNFAPLHHLQLIHWAFLTPGSNPLHQHYSDYIYVPPATVSAALGYTNYEADYRGLHEETGGLQLVHDFSEVRFGNGLAGWDVGLVSDTEKTIERMKEIREVLEGFLPGRINFTWQWCPVNRQGLMEGGLSIQDPMGAILNFHHINFVIDSPGKVEVKELSTSISDLQIKDDDATSQLQLQLQLLSNKPPPSATFQSSFSSLSQQFPHLPPFPPNLTLFSPMRGILKPPLETISIKFARDEEKGEIVGRIRVEGKDGKGWKEVRREIKDKKDWGELKGVDLSHKSLSARGSQA